MATKRALFCGLILALAGASAPALDLASGVLKVTLYEGQGRFSLAAMANPPEDAYTPLLFPEDPRTSSLSILVGSRVYRLGDSPAFKEAQEVTGTGARITWTSSSLSVTETFTFIASKGSAITDGVRIDLEVHNLSQQKQQVGVRYLFDTWLGEASRVHFRVGSFAQLGHELTLQGAELSGSWVSPLVKESGAGSGTGGGFGLQGMIAGEGLTTPDRVVFANWKRLSDAAWGYETSASRTFNLPPYSLNDSAVCYYYDPRSLSPGGRFVVTLALGRASALGFSGRQATPTTSAEFAAALRETMAEGAGTSDPTIAARADLATLNLLLAEIDRLLAASAGAGSPAGAGPSAEELERIEQAIATLEERATSAGR